MDYCSVCSSGAASLKSHGLFDLHLQKSQLGEFPHIGLLANISSMHHAGPSSSTLYQIINFNWSDKLMIGSSQLTVLLTPLNLCLSILKMQNLFSDTWFITHIIDNHVYLLTFVFLYCWCQQQWQHPKKLLGIKHFIDEKSIEENATIPKNCLESSISLMRGQF